MDFEVVNQGNICLLCPQTDEAREWVHDNLNVESWQYLGRNIGVDHRYIGDIVAGIQADGLSVE
jgi:hypothetical protein